ncbi:hypothetical protein [Roseburia hominis]
MKKHNRHLNVLLKKRLCSAVLSAVMLASFVFAAVPQDASAATSKPSTISIAAFTDKIKKAVDVDVLKDSGIENTKAATTVQTAAYLLEKADSSINGGWLSYDYDLFIHVQDYNRISDLKKAKKDYRRSLMMCYTKGIMIGKSNGKYSQSRKFLPTSKITKSEATKLVNRLSDTSKRFKLTYDGQLTRTVNLPKNYKEYPYILASFPNSFYEKKMWYTKQKNNSGWHAETPKQTAAKEDPEVRDMICDTVRKNLELRLNVNYKKTFTSKWKSELANTYFSPSDMTSGINKYVTAAKVRKVVVESYKIVVDPSMVWMDGTEYYVKVYVQFKVKSGSVPAATSKKQNEVIFGSYTAMKNMESHKTVTYCDEFKVLVSGNNGNIAQMGIEDGDIANVFVKSK